MWKSRYKSVRSNIIEMFGNKHVIDVRNYYRRGEKKLEKTRKTFWRAKCCCRHGGKYWDVIYGYKYWRSLELGKRIVEFVENGSSEGASVFYFLSSPSLSPLPPSRPPIAFRAVSDRKSNSRFIRRTELIYMFARVAQKVFLRDFSGKKSNVRREKAQMVIEFTSVLQHAFAYSNISTERGLY